MTSKLAWRAALALAAGVVGLIIATTIATTMPSAGGSSATLRKQKPFIARLALIRQLNTGELVSLRIAPFEVGWNSARVTLLNPLGKPQRIDSARLRLSRLESAEVLGEVDTASSGQSTDATFFLARPGWWQIDVIVNADSSASFYLKLDQPSSAPQAFAPPDYASEGDAQQVFETALARLEGLAGVKWREELTSGDPGPSGFGVWFLTDIDVNRQGLHATTLGMDEGASELYSDLVRQCVRQGRGTWQCSDGPAPSGPFDRAYMRSATGFAKGREELIDGEMTRIVFFYNRPQSAWYAWWIGEQTHYVRRQAMVAQGHFMLDRFSEHDVPAAIQPKDLPAS